MATEAEAAREARAKVIAAEGEMLASRALKEASDVISTSPAALQVGTTRFGLRIQSPKFHGESFDNSVVSFNQSPGISYCHSVSQYRSSVTRFLRQQLRYLQTLSNISAEKNSTIIFPLPIDLLTPFLNCGLRADANQRTPETWSAPPADATSP